MLPNFSLLLPDGRNDSPNLLYPPLRKAVLRDPALLDCVLGLLNLSLGLLGFFLRRVDLLLQRVEVLVFVALNLFHNRRKRVERGFRLIVDLAGGCHRLRLIKRRGSLRSLLGFGLLLTEIIEGFLPATEIFLVSFRLILLLAQLFDRGGGLRFPSIRHFKSQLLGSSSDVNAALRLVQNALRKRLVSVLTPEEVVQVEVVARAVRRGR